MRRSKAEPLSNVINDFLRQEGLETPLNQYRLVQAWPKVMGATISRYTKEVYVKNQTLFVKITSAPLKSDLMMNRTALVQQLNNAVGAYVIADIKFY